MADIKSLIYFYTIVPTITIIEGAMKNYQSSSFTSITLPKYIVRMLLAIGLIGGTGLQAQTVQAVNGHNPGIQVAVDWHTIDEPTYGARYQYTWNDIHLSTKEGSELSTTVELEISEDEGGGLFTMLSTPIAVPGSGMAMTFNRQVVMHPSGAELGTSLPNDPNAKCRNNPQGETRAVFHQVIDIIDAGTSKVLASHVDKCRFEVSRREVLNDMSRNGKVALDLSPFADHQIRIRTRILAAYNGRGPARASTPNITLVNATPTNQNLK
jgi:hypothetical protein